MRDGSQAEDSLGTNKSKIQRESNLTECSGIERERCSFPLLGNAGLITSSSQTSKLPNELTSMMFCFLNAYLFKLRD